MIEKKSPLIIDATACNGCGKCVEACIMNVLKLERKKTGSKEKVISVSSPDECVFCEACVISCRRIAIMINPRAGSCGMNGIPESLLKL